MIVLKRSRAPVQRILRTGRVPEAHMIVIQPTTERVAGHAVTDDFAAKRVLASNAGMGRETISRVIEAFKIRAQNFVAEFPRRKRTWRILELAVSDRRIAAQHDRVWSKHGVAAGTRTTNGIKRIGTTLEPFPPTTIADDFTNAVRTCSRRVVAACTGRRVPLAQDLNAKTACWCTRKGLWIAWVVRAPL